MTYTPRPPRMCGHCGEEFNEKGTAVYCKKCVNVTVQCKGCDLIEVVRRSSSRIKRGGEYCTQECKTVDLREEYSHDPLLHVLFEKFYSHVKRDYRKENRGQWEHGCAIKMSDYAERRCMKCDEMFKSESKGHRHCSNCTYTTFGRESSLKRHQLPMNQYGIKQAGHQAALVTVDAGGPEKPPPHDNKGRKKNGRRNGQAVQNSFNRGNLRQS